MSNPPRKKKASVLVCLDLDGTLFDRQGRISKRTQSALRKCLDEGAAVCFVTGRPHCFAKYTALSVDSRIGVISGAGACCEWEGERIIHEIPDDSLRVFVDCLEHSKARAFFKGLNTFYTHEKYDARFLYDTYNDRFPADCQVRSFTELSYSKLREKAEKIHKILVYEEEREQLDAFETRVSGIRGIQVSRYNEISFDVTAAGVDKGRAVRDIRERLELPGEAVLAVGDAPNDLPMFREAGVRIAMGNAKEEIRRMCDRVTASNEEDGAAQVLEHLEQYVPL